MTSTTIIRVYPNVAINYLFAVSDTEAFTVVVNGVEPDGGLLANTDTGVWSYSFTWNTNSPTNFSFSFIATDASNAATILKPLVSIIAAL